MKRTPLSRGTKQLKRTPLKKKGRAKMPKRDLMPNRIKRAIKELTELSHTFIRRRDGIDGEIRGHCCTCGKYCEGKDYHCGHYEPNSTGGAILRYHPHNMHGQGGYCCNINRHGQQKMGNDYTLFMIKRYGIEYVEKIRALKQKSIDADIIFYETMIELYKQGDEQAIVDYLHSL